MTLRDIVEAMVLHTKPSDKDIVNTIMFLTRDDVLLNQAHFKKLVKQLNRLLEYEETKP
jgi:hypothetical protein